MKARFRQDGSRVIELPWEKLHAELTMAVYLERISAAGDADDSALVDYASAAADTYIAHYMFRQGEV